MSDDHFFRLWDAKDVAETLKMWRKQYPDLIRVGTSQTIYNLPRAGTSDDCPYEEGAHGCSNYFFTIQDFLSHPEGSESSLRLPELFWNGGLHGDDVLGTSVLMETASLLLIAATCESLPREGLTSSPKELLNAKDCRDQLALIGIDDKHRKWMARLVSTRRIVIVPSANMLGYFRGDQNEGLTNNPEVDFPYGIDERGDCMQTVAARTIDKLFNDHMFQIALSFESGGDRGIGYSWGVEAANNATSPDNYSQDQIARAFASAMNQKSQLKIGQINSIFEHRDGAIEDWAYAASWDDLRPKRCLSGHYGSYSISKSPFNNATNRAIAMRIATGANTAMQVAKLGSARELFDESSSNSETSEYDESGSIVAQHVRLALASADLVQPYVSIYGVNDLGLSDDVIPLSSKSSGKTCLETKMVAVSEGTGALFIEWTIGGAIEISNTELWYAKESDLTGQFLGDCLEQPESMDGFNLGYALGSKNGTGIFSENGPEPHPQTSFVKIGDSTLGPAFKAAVDISNVIQGERVILIASAIVDQQWKNSPSDNYKPRVNPQSHLANARTNQRWHFENVEKQIDGQLIWYSVPVSILVTEARSHVGVIELSNRFSPRTHTGAGVDNRVFDRFSSTLGSSLLFLTLAIMATIIIYFLTQMLRRRRAAANAKSRILKNVGTVSSNDSLENSGFIDTFSHVQVFDNSYVYDYDDDGTAEIIDFQWPTSSQSLSQNI